MTDTPANLHERWPAIVREPFGEMPDGRRVDAFTIENPSGVRVRFLSYGGIITSILVPDRAGVFADVALGYDTLDEYRRDRSYFGALVGRYANRIAGGRFHLDGRSYVLARNDGPNHLHGGVRGFDKSLWEVEPFTDGRGTGATLRLTSPAGEEGYPGTLDATVTYTLTAGAALEIDYQVTTTAPTPANLTQHSYFNLAGEGSGDVLAHELTLAASAYTPVDPTLIPTAELAPVAGTPFDFRTPTPIGARIDLPDEQLRRGGGYDHNFVLDRTEAGLSLAAELYEPRSGRTVTVQTTEPGIQFFSGNTLGNGLTGKGGKPYAFRSGLALETQRFPDSPNQPHFPSSILRPGQEYRSRTVYQFLVRS